MTTFNGWRQKTFILMFQPRFARLVESGEKLQTVRPVRKRPIFPGDMLSLREWTGAPYRSKQRLLGESPCIGVSPVDIKQWGVLVRTAGFDAELFAKRDGFSNFSDMRSWFESEHGLPFSGELIQWQPLPQRRRKRYEP